LKVGSRVDGSKAERELGISYTPLEQAIKEAIEADRGKAFKKTPSKDLGQVT